MFAVCLVLAVKFNEELGFHNSNGQVYHFDYQFALAVPFKVDDLVAAQLEFMETVNFELFVDYDLYKMYSDKFLDLLRLMKQA